MPYMKNVKFLRQYQRRPINLDGAGLLLQKVAELRSTDPESLLASVCQDAHDRAHLLPTLWGLVAQQKIGADLNQPLTMRSPIWITTAAMIEEQK